MKKTKAEALKWLAETFEEPPGKITVETSRDQIAAWDSLGVLTLMAGLDQEFGITLASGEIQAIASASDFLAVLAKHDKLSD